MSDQATELLRKLTNRVERLAFDMPAPNEYTPQFVQLCQEARAFLSHPQPTPEEVREALEASLLSGRLFGNYEEPLNDYGKRIVRVILTKIGKEEKD